MPFIDELYFMRVALRKSGTLNVYDFCNLEFDCVIEEILSYFQNDITFQSGEINIC
jgi:hypothetical protein